MLHDIQASDASPTDVLHESEEIDTYSVTGEKVTDNWRLPIAGLVLRFLP